MTALPRAPFRDKSKREDGKTISLGCVDFMRSETRSFTKTVPSHADFVTGIMWRAPYLGGLQSLDH